MVKVKNKSKNCRSLIFICDLFKNAISNLSYVASDDRMINEQDCERVCCGVH